jgi:hypothetical protein
MKFYYLINKKHILGHEITIGAMIGSGHAFGDSCAFFKFGESFKWFNIIKPFRKAARYYWKLRDCLPTFISRVQYSCDDPSWSAWSLEFYWCGHFADWTSHGDGADSVNRCGFLRGLELTLKGQTRKRSDED